MSQILRNYVKTIAIIDLVIAFVLYLLPFIFHVCKENGYVGCGIRNFNFAWGSEVVKKICSPVVLKFRHLSNNTQWIVIVFAWTINFIRMFWQSISLLKSTITNDAVLLKIWLILETISSILAYLFLYNPWVFTWGNVILYSANIIAASVYKILTIFPVALYRNFLVRNIHKSHQEFSNEDELEETTCNTHDMQETVVN